MLIHFRWNSSQTKSQAYHYTRNGTGILWKYYYIIPGTCGSNCWDRDNHRWSYFCISSGYPIYSSSYPEFKLHICQRYALLTRFQPCKSSYFWTWVWNLHAYWNRLLLVLYSRSYHLRREGHCSKLGYLMLGQVPSSLQCASSSILLQFTSTTAIPHELDLEIFWSNRYNCEQIIWSIIPQNVSRKLHSSVTSRNVCTYLAKFPWKESRLCLPSNNKICLKRINNNLNKLRRSLEVLKFYDSIVQD